MLLLGFGPRYKEHFLRSLAVWNVIRLLGIRHLITRRLRTAFTVLGILLGAAFFTSVRSINGSVAESFRNSVRAVSGGAALTVSGGPGGFPEDRLDRARGVPGVAAAIALLDVSTHLEGGSPLRVLGLDLADADSLDGYGAKSAFTVPDRLGFIAHPDSVLLPRALARRLGVRLGSHVGVSSPFGPRELVVRGLYEPDATLASLGEVAFMDIDAARLIFDREGRIDELEIRLARGFDVDSVAARLRPVMGSGLWVERPEGRADDLEATVGAFEAMLGFFGWLALGSGLFLVAATARMTVEERRAELATIQALGFTRRGVLAALCLELALLAGLASALGAWLGFVLARALLGPVASAMGSQTGVSVAASHAGLDWALWARAVAGVTACAVAAGFASALDAMTPDSRRARAFSWAGFALLMLFEAIGRAPATFAPGLVAVLQPIAGFGGAALAGPALVGWLVRGAARARGWLPRASSRLALGNLGATRSSSHVASLLVALLVVTVVSVVRASFLDTLLGRYDGTLREDLIVSSSDRLISPNVAPISEKLGPELARVPGVAVGAGAERGAYGLRVARIRYGGTEVQLKAFDEPGPSLAFRNFDLIDRPAAEAGPELYSGGPLAIFVSRAFSERFEKRTGDTIALETPSGVASARIAGLIADLGSGGGLIVMSRERYKALWGDSLVTGFGIRVIPGVDPESVRAELLRRFGARGLRVVSRRELKEQIRSAIEQSFGQLRAVEGVALAIGMLGLVNALAVSVLRRRREIGMLRAVGASRGQIAAIIVQEACIQGVFAAGAAIALGVWVARGWVARCLFVTFGWLVEFHVPWAALAGCLLLSVVLSLVAGLWPARQAADTPILEAIGRG